MKKNIVVIDDEPFNRFIVENLLTEYNIISFNNGKNILEYLSTNKVDLILLDIMMPVEDGYQVAKKITSNENFKDIPIIFLTAKEGGLSVKQGFEAGGYDYILKPFDQIALKARIEKAIEKKAAELELRKQSITDPLTNLYNRRYFFERLNIQIEHIKRNKSNFSIAILDIDHFKKVNDDYGHLAGDNILRELSDILIQYTRPYDIVARYGGEEFVIMFVDCDKTISAEIIRRIKNKVNENIFEFENNKIKFSFSCGISDINDIANIDSINPEELLKIADNRLLAAKNSGRDKIIENTG